MEQGTRILHALKEAASDNEEKSNKSVNLDSVNICFNMLSKSYDNLLGGFSQAPKFPQPG